MSADVPLDQEEFGRWRDGADRALDVACLQLEAAFYEWACFSAEQCAQLAVKGLLHGLGRDPRGHDLVFLANAVEDAGIALQDDVRSAFRRLTRHYIATRYPDAHPAGAVAPHYGLTDAEEAISDARVVLRFVDAAWAALDA